MRTSLGAAGDPRVKGGYVSEGEDGFGGRLGVRAVEEEDEKEAMVSSAGDGMLWKEVCLGPSKLR